jgi:hypothetical protein
MTSTLVDELMKLNTKLENLELELTNQMMEIEIKAENWYQIDKKAEEIINKNKNLTIVLNVGGKLFETKLETLLSVKDTLFYKIILSDKLDLNKEIFIDRDYKNFKNILSFLRNKKIDRNVLSLEMYEILTEEAEFYGITELVELLSNKYFKLTGVVSRYNNNYYCNVEAYEYIGNEIRIYIDMKGDISLGSIQNPRSSKLIEINTKKNIPLKNAKFTFEDSNRGYIGYLAYNFNELVPGNYYFTFGDSGYTQVMVFSHK